MIDGSVIGNSGLIIEYDDIISMIGFNIAKKFRGNNINKKLDSMSIQDILLSYVNRTKENYIDWLKDEFDIEINNPSDMLKSFEAMQPNMLYAYKMFNAATIENVNSLFIYSKTYSPMIEESVEKSFGASKVKYLFGDIKKILNNMPNITFTTASYDTVKKCKDLNVPICLVVCDDYLYMGDLFTDKVDKDIMEKSNICLRFTSVLSAGLI